MKKIDIEKMGEKEVRHETNGIVITTFDSGKAAKEIAEKVNEIIDYIQVSDTGNGTVRKETITAAGGAGINGDIKGNGLNT